MPSRLTAMLLAALWSLSASIASASAIVIWPVDPTIAKDEKATALWIENHGNAPQTMQVRLFAWDQKDGTDVLTDQNDLVASPPIATIPAGGRQLVRVVRRGGADAPTEHAYRLFVDELPDMAAQAKDDAPAKLIVQMRYSIPLFTYATERDAITPQLDAHIVAGAGGRMLAVHNGGTRHARLSDLRSHSGRVESTIKGGLIGYVLPGSTVTIPLPPSASGPFEVQVDGKNEPLGPVA